MTFVPACGSSGPTMILNAVSAASAFPRRQPLPREQAGRLWSSLPVLGHPPKLGGLNMPQWRGCPVSCLGPAQMPTNRCSLLSAAQRRTRSLSHRSFSRPQHPWFGAGRSLPVSAQIPCAASNSYRRAGVSPAHRSSFLGKDVPSTAAPAACRHWGCRRGSRVLTAAAKIFVLGHELLQHRHFGPVVAGAAQVAASREPATEETVLCSLSYHNAKPCQKSAGSVTSRC